MTNNFWRSFWTPVAWAAVLFIQSSIPDFDPPLHLSRWDDKWGHVLIYMPLGFLLRRALTRSKTSIPERRLFLLTLLIGSLYGVSDEIHQYFVPGRSPDWRDWIADSIGVALGAWIFSKTARQSHMRGLHRRAPAEKTEH
ncbi:MAG: VanZ family protein [bacterium]